MTSERSLFEPYIHAGPLALGFVDCLNGSNPVADSTGWHITTGKEYLVARISHSGNWFTIVADNNELGSYHKSRFGEIRKEHQDDKASS
jgi:hypothetical protein